MAAKKTIVKPVVKSSAKTAEAAVKVEAPQTASVKAEDKATTPEEPVMTEEKTESEAAKKETAKKETIKKTPAKKTPAEKVPAKKETDEKESAQKEAEEKESAQKETDEKESAQKEAEEKVPAKKAELKTELHVQFANQSLTQDDLVKIAKDVWEYDLNQKVSDMKTLELYVKPEERRAYYVINKEFTGSFGI